MTSALSLCIERNSEFDQLFAPQIMAKFHRASVLIRLPSKFEAALYLQGPVAKRWCFMRVKTKGQ